MSRRTKVLTRRTLGQTEVNPRGIWLGRRWMSPARIKREHGPSFDQLMRDAGNFAARIQPLERRLKWRRQGIGLKVGPSLPLLGRVRRRRKIGVGRETTNGETWTRAGHITIFSQPRELLAKH